MNRVLTTVLAVALLLGLGALAVLALPGASAPLAAAPFVSAAAPDAPMAAQNVNAIAMPLDATNQFTAAGVNFDADGLATIVGPGVQQVLKWNATSGYQTWYPPDQDGDNFLLTVGGSYRLVLDNTANTIVSFVGDVPAQGAVKFTLVRPTGVGCVINDISLPLDQSAVADADDLAQAIGNVDQVLFWDKDTQGYKTWYPADQDGDNFTTLIGYPYRVCLLSGGATTWP